MFSFSLITVDGGAATGKGAVASALAHTLKLNYLDSGVFYRALGYCAIEYGVKPDDEAGLINLANQLSLQFSEGEILLVSPKRNTKNSALKTQHSPLKITKAIRSEECSTMASLISPWQGVRQALMQSQRRALQAPGLVAEGRDMGTVVFPEAECKIFLECNVDIRAQRRQKQLEIQGVYANINKILSALQERDERDKSRAVSPLMAAKDAVIVDTSHLSLAEVIDRCLQICRNAYPKLISGKDAD